MLAGEVDGMILDVGCGVRASGHVNVDLFVGKTAHRGGVVIDLKAIPNFVQADAHFLPFKDKVFDVVVSRHVVEHLVNPSKAVLEMLRVCVIEVVIRVPHRYARNRGSLRYRQCAEHRHFFGELSLRNWLKSLHLSFEVEVVWQFFPHRVIPIVSFPREMIVRIRAKK